MMSQNAKRLSAIVAVHGVSFELSAKPSDGSEPITESGFQKYVDRLTRMVIGLSKAEAETLRDELLIIDGLGTGVRLDALAEHHPLSMSATSSAAGATNEAAQVRIRAFDPVLNPALKP